VNSDASAVFDPLKYQASVSTQFQEMDTVLRRQAEQLKELGERIKTLESVVDNLFAFSITDILVSSTICFSFTVDNWSVNVFIWIVWLSMVFCRDRTWVLVLWLTVMQNRYT
jgi:hypothetical protein